MSQINTLNYKFTIATIAGFLTSSLVFLGLFLTFYQSELETERAQAARDVNYLLQTSLETSMLKRDLDGLNNIVKKLGQQTNINRVMILNPKGQVRFSSHPDSINTTLVGQWGEQRSASTSFTFDKNSMEVLRSIRPVLNKPACQECHGTMQQNPVNGILVIDYDASSIRHKARNTTLILMGAGALIVIINLLGGWWFIQRFILKPVKKLGDASMALAEGKLDTRVNLPGKDELTILGNTFNSMADNLQSNMQKLQEDQEFLQSLVDAIPDGIRIIDENYNMLLVNEAFRHQTRLTDTCWEGKKCYEATQQRTEPCPSELINCSLKETLKSGKPFKVIRRHPQYDGNFLDVEIYAAPMTIKQNNVEKILMVESIRDLSKEVKFTHEQRLSEIGRLAANVAHEIYNPLSSMQLALNSLNKTLDSERNEYNGEERRSYDVANYLQQASKSMDQCIQMTERLLRLSTAPLGTKDLVDVKQAIKDILALVKWDAEESSIIVSEHHTDKMLRVFASESELRMLFLNLIQNAFHAMMNGGELNITSDIQDKNIIIKFEDNGVGIAEENLKSIFMPFFSRRADNVKGTGLGLPISQTIVSSYGGKIEVESTLAKGSCFIVTLPEASMERLIQ
jgi:PAS domain S-box-containing protein